jgi:hypothetical protein
VTRRWCPSTSEPPLQVWNPPGLQSVRVKERNFKTDACWRSVHFGRVSPGVASSCATRARTPPTLPASLLAYCRSF